MDGFSRVYALLYACNRLTDRLKYSAAVQTMDLSNRDDSDRVRYSAAYPTGAERFFFELENLVGVGE